MLDIYVQVVRCAGSEKCKQGDGTTQWWKDGEERKRSEVR